LFRDRLLGTLGFVVFALLISSAADHLTAQTGSLQTRGVAVELEWRTENKWIHKCRGTRIGNVVLTARHCLKDLGGPLEKTLRILEAGKKLELKAVPNPAEVNGTGAVRSALFDFALLELKAKPNEIAQTPVSPDAALFQPVLVGTAENTFVRCKVAQICSGALYINQCTIPPEYGWSGSGVWLDTPERRLVGVITDKDTMIASQGARATGIWTILGRSSFLLGEDRYYQTFRRNKSYQYLPEGDACRTLRNSKFVTKRVGSPKSFATAPIGLNERLILYADNFSGHLVVYDVVANKPVSSTPIPDDPSMPPGTFAIRSNAVVRLAGSRFAIAQSGPGDNGPGSILLFNFDPSQPGILPTFGVRHVASIGHTVITAALIGNELLIGGEDGLCRVVKGSCERLGTNVWSVLSIVANGPKSGIALGRDFIGSGPAATRVPAYAPIILANSVAQLGHVFLVAKAENQQFNVGTVVGSRFVAFGSNGAAFELKGSRFRSIPVTGLYNSSDRIEDAIRGVALVDESHLAIVGTEGSFRLLSIEDKNGRLHLSALNQPAENDVSIAATGVAVTVSWAVVSTQEGSLFSLRCRKNRPIQVSLAFCN
jgi:hypothetical protein